MRSQTKDAFSRALEISRTLAAAAGQGPERDLAHLLTVVSADVNGRVPPTQMVEPLGVTSLTLTTSAPANIGPFNVNFPSDGWVIGITATVAEDPSYRGAVGMSLLESGSSVLFTNGSTEAYVSLACFTGPDMDGSHAFRLRRRVNVNTKWQVKFSVLRSVLAAGSVTYTPKVYFLFESDSAPGLTG